MENNINSNNYQNRVTTSGMTLFDENGTMLRMAYLDESLSLVIGEPVLADNGKKSYPQEKRHPFIITLDRAASLLTNIIETKVYAALENGTNYNGGIFLNRRKDAIFEIRVQDGDVYLVYYKDIQEDRTPKDTFVFKCNKTCLIENYAPDGSSADQTEVEGFFYLFCKYLQAGVFDLMNSSTHSFRKANAATTTAIFNYLKQIAVKVGATVERAKPYQPAPSSGFMNSENGEEEELPFSSATPAATSLEGMLS